MVLETIIPITLISGAFFALGILGYAAYLIWKSNRINEKTYELKIKLHKDEQRDKYTIIKKDEAESYIIDRMISSLRSSRKRQFFRHVKASVKDIDTWSYDDELQWFISKMDLVAKYHKIGAISSLSAVTFFREYTEIIRQNEDMLEKYIYELDNPEYLKEFVYAMQPHKTPTPEDEDERKSTAV